MEFYVVKKEQLTFHNMDMVSNTDPNITTKRGELNEAPLTLASVPNCVKGCLYGAKSFRTPAMKMLCGSVRELYWDWTRTRLISLTVDLTMTSTKTANVKILARNGHSLDELPGYQIFERLIFSGLPPTSFELNLNLKLDLNRTEFEVNAKSLKIRLFEGDGYGLEATGIEITEEMLSAWESTGHEDDFTSYYLRLKKIEFKGEMTLTLRLDHCAVTKLYLNTLGSSETLWPRNLMIEGVESDLVILAGGEKDKEKGIKCHKKILSERYPGFPAIIRADMSESKDNCLEIVDMTEAGVRAMLQFIYARDLEEASKKCEIAVELLEAGHKYGMADLEDAMMQIIWAKPVEWVSVDLAMKMLLFSRNIGGKFEHVEKSSLVILKWYAQESGSLMKSEEFQNLFLEYPRIAMELAESFLKI